MCKPCPSLYTCCAQIGHWLGHMCTFPSSFPAWALQVSQLGHSWFTFVNKSVSKLGIPTFTAVKRRTLHHFQRGQSLYSPSWPIHLGLDSKLYRLPDSDDGMDLCSNYKGFMCWNLPRTDWSLELQSLLNLQYHITSEVQ